MRPTSTYELVYDSDPIYNGATNTAKAGMGGVWFVNDADSSSDSSSSSSNSSSGKVAASAPKLSPVKEFPPHFIEAPKSKTAAIEAKKRTAPKPKKLSIESFTPIKANMNHAKLPRSPSIPLPRDTG
jgi:hypothetical protein